MDTQTHFQQPAAGTVSCDDFYTGTRAALAGGTTTVLDVVMPERGESLVEAHNKWAEWADQKACCDYGLHVGVTYWSEKVLKLWGLSWSRRHALGKRSMGICVE